MSQMSQEQIQAAILAHFTAREQQKLRNERNKEKAAAQRKEKKQFIDSLLSNMTPEDLAAYIELAKVEAAHKMAAAEAKRATGA